MTEPHLRFLSARRKSEAGYVSMRGFDEPVTPPTPEQRQAVLDQLAAHDALDLADMLGLTQETR